MNKFRARSLVLCTARHDGEKHGQNNENANKADAGGQHYCRIRYDGVTKEIVWMHAFSFVTCSQMSLFVRFVGCYRSRTANRPTL